MWCLDLVHSGSLFITTSTAYAHAQMGGCEQLSSSDSCVHSFRLLTETMATSYTVRDSTITVLQVFNTIEVVV